MSDQVTVLSIDDNPTNQLLIEKSLEKFYHIELAHDGPEGLAKAASLKPAVILLDVNMPGMDGYEVCKKLRECSATENTPVIFISAQTDIDDRLRGYEAGGDDYLCKPVDIMELRKKIELNIEVTQHKKQLDQQAQTASTVAMTAMTSANELGIILNFVEQTYHARSYAELASCVFTALNIFGLNACLQIRSDQNVESFSSSGQIKPLEEEVLSRAATASRIIEKGRRCLFNAPSISILVKNMPESADASGRMRDNFAHILRAAEARIDFINFELKAAEQRQKYLAEAIQKTQQELSFLDQQFSNFGQQTQQLIDDLAVQIEDVTLMLGLSESQEAMLMDLLNIFREKMEQVVENSLEIESRFNKLQAIFVKSIH